MYSHIIFRDLICWYICLQLSQSTLYSNAHPLEFLLNIPSSIVIFYFLFLRKVTRVNWIRVGWLRNSPICGNWKNTATADWSELLLNVIPLSLSIQSGFKDKHVKREGLESGERQWPEKVESFARTHSDAWRNP